MFRTDVTGRHCGKRCSLHRRWSCPAELVAVDQLLDDERFFEPFRRWFDPAFVHARQGGPSNAPQRM